MSARRAESDQCFHEEKFFASNLSKEKDGGASEAEGEVARPTRHGGAGGTHALSWSLGLARVGVLRPAGVPKLACYGLEFCFFYRLKRNRPTLVVST